MDLANISSKDSADVTHKINLIDPINGNELEHEEKSMYVVVVGQNSKQFEASSSRLINNAEQAKKYGKQTFSLAKQNIKNANLFASCTRELFIFHNGKWVFIKVEGVQTEAQHKAIKNIYLEYDWMASQVDEEIGTKSNFLGKSKPNSASTSNKELGSTLAQEANLKA